MGSWPDLLSVSPWRCELYQQESKLVERAGVEWGCKVSRLPNCLVLGIRGSHLPPCTHVHAHTHTYIHPHTLAGFPLVGPLVPDSGRRRKCSCPLAAPGLAWVHLPGCGLLLPCPASPKRPRCDSSGLESGERTWVLSVPGSLPAPSAPAPWPVPGSELPF